MFRNTPLADIPPAVKGLLLINGGALLLTVILQSLGIIDLTRILGLYYYKSTGFKPLQIITHMFMHGGFMHLLFNMYALWMFGKILEEVWGTQRFFIYYIVTGLGAAILHTAVNYYQVQNILSTMQVSEIETVFREGYDLLSRNMNYRDTKLGSLNILINTPTVGASGAVFGILLAFGMLFPNVELMLMFIPIPIKAKYFVIAYGAIELYSGMANTPGDNVAHFAHLGGMLFGYILIKLWGKNLNGNNF